MSPQETRLYLIIDAVIERVGLLRWMELEDAQRILQVRAHEAWSSPDQQPDAVVYCILHRRAVDAVRHFPRDLAFYDAGTSWSEDVASLGGEAPPTADQRTAALGVLALIDAGPEQTFIRNELLAGKGHAEIAEEAGISRTRVQQIVDQAITKTPHLT
jgi:DNA-directed RNA polymerase specialized sigma24 family protein